ncbi:nuclease-related domain-containing protein [Cellulomonas sp. P24]|uniref:nuclease-related domain-containing protein n=1 Tax=Cellulomonas sp. P24 TaxID=2885206 RepID=UPI00216B0F6D|nr:nuclease-related domain-containing protein [Cellulomonas sp. P24]MCR6492457.1 NERD domain-containing protein [Cellulomonas sp. P24]
MRPAALQPLSATADSSAMGEFEIRNWRRYGKDRTYVIDTGTGVQIGYRDNLSGALIPADPTTAQILSRWAALADAGFAFAEAVPVVVDAASAEQPSAPTAPSGLAEGPGAFARFADEDLSARRPGYAARARAREELEARRAEVGKVRTWLGRLVDAHTDERAWRIGADAEESIGEELERLITHGWRVLHSVPVGAGDSDIDHVLIGPPGVLTVNSKHHPGANVWVVPKQIRVNNQPVPYLRNSRHEAARAAKLLTAAAGFPVPATAVLIFRLGSGSLTIREHPGDVLVYRATKAFTALRNLPPRLTVAQVGALYEAARWHSTWQPR